MDNKLPQPLPVYDLDPVRIQIKRYFEALQKGLAEDGDYDTHIAEAIIQALYGPEVWNWINDRPV